MRLKPIFSVALLLAGFVAVLAGVYLAFGVAWLLISGGVTLMVYGVLSCDRAAANAAPPSASRVVELSAPPARGNSDTVLRRLNQTERKG